MDEQHHILIIDDDPTYRKMLSMALEKLGYKATAAASSVAALTIIDENDISIALIDRLLRGESGLDLIERINIKSPGTVCVIITSHASEKTALEAIRLGAYSYLEKPINLQDLHLTIHRAIDKMETERSIKSSERFAHAIINGLTAHVAILDQDGIILTVNQAWRDFAEANPPVGSNVAEGANYLNICDTVSGEASQGAANFAQAIRDVLEGKQEYASLEYPCHSPNEKRWFIARMSPLPGDGPPAVIVAHEDITERKLAEEILRNQVDLLDTISDAVLAADNDYFLTSWNKAAETIYGWTADEVIGLNVRDLLDTKYPDDPDGKKDEAVLKEFAETGYWAGDLIQKKKDGSQIYLAASATIIYDPEGKPIGGVSVNRDITSQKQAEQRQDAVYKIAQSAAQAKDLNTLYKSIHETIRKVMPSENFFIALYDEKSDITSYPYYVDEVDAPPPPEKVETSLTKYVLRTGKSLLGTIERQKELVDGGEAVIIGTPSPIWLGVPLIAEGKTIGAMAVQHYSDPEAFGEREMRLLEFVSSQVAQAIEHHRTIDALRQSEAFTRAVIDLSPIGVSVRDKNGRLLSHNKAWQEIFAIHDEDIQNDLTRVRKKLRFDERDDYFKPYQKKVRQVFKKGGFLHIPELKTIGRRPEAASWISQYFYAIEDDQGNVDHVVILTEDITERKEIEEALRESETKFRTLFKISPFAIVLSDLQGNIQECNPQFVKMHATKEGPEGQVGRNVSDFFPEEEWPSIMAEIKQTIQDEKNLGPREHVMLREDGTSFSGETMSTIIKDDQGNPVGLLANAQDITDRKNAETALRESEEKYRRIFNNSLTGIYITVDGAIALCNQAYAQIFGYQDVEEIIGNPSMDVVTPESRGLVSSEVNARMSGEKEVSNYVCKGQKKDGTIIDMEIFGTTIELDGKLALYGAIIDITESVKAQKEIRKLNEELEQRVFDRTAELEASNKELEAFAYSVSHDLRAPLRAINGFSTLLEENYAHAIDDEGVKYLNKVRASSLKMDRLINDLLTLSRLGRQDISPTSIKLTSIAKRVFSDLTRETPDRKMEFKVSPSPTVVADKHLMEVMLTNLLSNAIKFTRGKEPALIEFGHQENEEGIHFFLRDNGVGFDMKYVDKIFTPFQRLHIEEEYEGTGIGLAIVYRIIQRHRGRVWVESEEGKGTVFFFQL